MVMAGGHVPRAALGVLVTCCLLVIVTSQQSIGDGDTQYLQRCCGSKLMDSVGYVMLHSDTPLPSNMYGKNLTSVQTRLCTRAQVHIQLWRETPGNSGRWRFIREVILKRADAAPEATQQVFNLPETWIIGPEDRLALYSPTISIIPIPYEFDAMDTAYTVKLSNQRYLSADALNTTDAFNGNFTNMEITLDPLRFPRLFFPYIYFCDNTFCSGGVYPSTNIPNLQTLLIVGPPGPQGEKGPKGEPGIPGNFGGNDDPSGTFTCDVPGVSAEVSAAGEKITQLEGRIGDMQRTLDSIYNSNSVTGLCPTGMVPGSYGVGSCYAIRKEKVPMAVAELLCQTDFTDAHLVAIETDLEERFLKNEILRVAGVGQGLPGIDLIENYWTSGMYNLDDGTWVWYNELSKRQVIQQYFNWRGVRPPTPRSKTEVCSTLNVNLQSTVADWTINTCSSYLYYICELPKRCL